MKTTLKTDITVKDICDGFVYNELEGKGLFGLSGKLVIQPEYQRNYIETPPNIACSGQVRALPSLEGIQPRRVFSTLWLLSANSRTCH